MKGWNITESEGLKVADTIFSRDGKLLTLIFKSRKVAEKTYKD